MEAPKCRICGEKHWDRVCVAYPDVTLPEPRNVTEKPVRNVTPNILRITELEAEVVHLKRVLAEHVCPVCERRRAEAAARVAKHRANKPC